MPRRNAWENCSLVTRNHCSIQASCTVKNLKDEELHSLLFTSISLSSFLVVSLFLQLLARGLALVYGIINYAHYYYIMFIMIRGFCLKKSQLGVASYHQQATNYVKSFLAIDVRLSDFCFNHISLSCVQKGNEWVSGSTILRSKDAILWTCDKYLILKVVFN